MALWKPERYGMDDDGHALEVVEKWEWLPNSLGHAFEFVEKWVPDSLGHAREFD